MEPLLPKAGQDTLARLTCDILAASGRLTGQIHSKEELMLLVRALIDEGEIPRGRVKEITGKGATVSVEIIRLGLREGLVESPSPKGPLHPGFPSKILEFYFPQLFVDLPTEEPTRGV